MLKYIVKRIISLIPVLIIISIFVFGLMKAMPGDPIQMMMPMGGGVQMTQEEYDKMYKNLEKKYGFDQPVHVQYIKWVQKTLKGDFGDSTKARKPVKDYLAEPLRNTLLLNLGSTIISFVLSILIGIRSAVKRGGFFDKFFQVFTLIGMSLPTFFIGLFLIFFFGFKLNWLPANGMPKINGFAEWIKYLVLPTLTLTIGSLASISRYVRNAMLDALNQDYIRTARAKGLREKTVIYSHAFRNAMIPVVTSMTWAILAMFSGSAITESVFAYRGIGKELIDGVLAADNNIVLTLTMFYALLTLLGNLIMDISYALVDPRVKLEA
ncbi:MAG: ABC transporter permease [Tissierellia bacterium]|nr:ABC transporter permease [Tissierellia bacterium]